MTRRQIRCQRARQLIPDYLDGALTLGEREQLDAHLSSCPLCTRELRNAERLETRTRVALRSVVGEHSLSSQREAEIRKRLLAAASSSQRRRWQRPTISGVVAGLAALILLFSAGLATLRPTPPPSEQRGFVSYSSGPADRDVLFSERGRSALRASPVTITFLDATLPKEAYQSFITRFQKENPDVTVELRQPDSSLSDASTLADQGDCFVADANITNALAQGQIRSLTRFAQADAQIKTSDFFPVLLNMVEADQQLYGLPRSAQVRLTFFNTHTLEKNGITLPHAPWTSNELAATVELLNKRIAAGTFAYLPYDGYDVAYLLTQRGAQAPYVGNGRLDTGATVAAVDWYAQLVQPDSAVMALNSSEAVAQRQKLAASNHAIIWTAPPMRGNNVTVNLGIAPLPQDDNQPNALQADAYFISKNASGSRAGACWRWIRYLSAQSPGSNHISARISQVRSPAFAQHFGERQTQAIIDTLSRTAANEPWTPTTVAALAEAVDDVVMRGASPRDALLRVQHFLELE